MSIPIQTSFLSKITSQPGSYLLHERYDPRSILEPRENAPKGKIWCRHCQGYVAIGLESVSHQNLVRLSQVCMDCYQWNYLDEQVPIEHRADCQSKGGEKVIPSVGGNSSRATRVPPRDADQEEAAAWPHV